MDGRLHNDYKIKKKTINKKGAVKVKASIDIYQCLLRHSHRSFEILTCDILK